MLGFFDKKKKILFIEDNADILATYQNFFSLGGSKTFSGVFASNKEEFLSHIDKVDIVVSDYHVPSLKFEEVKRRCAENNIPLILISGDIQPYHKLQLGKPVQMKTIMNMVENQFKPKVVKKAA